MSPQEPSIQPTQSTCSRFLPGLESPDRAVVMVTHDKMVAGMARRQISMRDGQIVADELQVA